MISYVLKLKQILDKYSRDEMTVYAAQASFFIILSTVPFFMLLLTLIQVIPAISQADLQKAVLDLVPDVLAMDSVIFRVIDDLYTKSPGTLLSVSAITALWSASKGMMSMERGLNRVWGVTVRRNYIVRRLICSVYTIIFVLVCIFSLLLLVFGTALQNMIFHRFPFLAELTSYILSFRSLFALTVLTICFTGLYTILPKARLHPRSQLPGAVFSTLCWIIFSYVFSIYFNNFQSYSYMYGSLTAIVLLMLWLYFGICILFFGAEINYFQTSLSNNPCNNGD